MIEVVQKEFWAQLLTRSWGSAECRPRRYHARYAMSLFNWINVCDPRHAEIWRVWSTFLPAAAVDDVKWARVCFQERDDTNNVSGVLQRWWKRASAVDDCRADLEAGQARGRDGDWMAYKWESLDEERPFLLVAWFNCYIGHSENHKTMLLVKNYTAHARKEEFALSFYCLCRVFAAKNHQKSTNFGRWSYRPV